MILCEHYTIPHFTGIDVVVKIREVREDIPVILCSGFVQKGMEEEANQACISIVLRKQTSTFELARAIGFALD